MRELAILYDRPLPRYQLASPDAEPTHFVAALVKPGGRVERVRVAYMDPLASIRSLLCPQGQQGPGNFLMAR
jgi:hypothetical protein